MDPLEYARDLKRQVDDREKEKARAKQEQEAYDRKIEAEIEEYNPWGRGGGGAPIKDAQVFAFLQYYQIYNRYKSMNLSRPNNQ